MTLQENAPSRRSFLVGAGAALAGSALAMAGCSPSAPKETTEADAAAESSSAAGNLPASWDYEADFVVVGAGTGLTGALAAAVQGDKVIVLEADAVAGGTMSRSGGVTWVACNSIEAAEGIKDTKEDAMAYLRACAEGQADEEILEVYVDRGTEMADFVQENSPITWMISDFRRCYEYHPEFEGALFRGRSLYPYEDADPARRGGLLAQGLVDGVEAAGGEIMLNTQGTRLVSRTDADGNTEVLGVWATDKNGKQIAVKANKGVLLSAGGFDWNDAMKTAFLRGPYWYTNASPYCDGTGIKMAQAVGADLANMSECWGYPAYTAPSEAGYADKMGFAGYDHAAPGVIVVNRYGERFMDEACDYDSNCRSFLAWNNWNDQADFGYRNLPAFTIMDELARKKFGIAYHYGDDIPEYAVQADTLAELAEKLGVDPEGLEATVAEFNANAEQLVDPKFHRGESAYDRMWNQKSTGEGPEETLAPLTMAPFWGIEVSLGMLGTCGGARVNTDAQVLDAFGNPIARLYAAGNNSGVGSPGAGYTGGGATIGPAMTFAYIAGMHASGLEPWV